MTDNSRMRLKFIVGLILLLSVGCSTEAVPTPHPVYVDPETGIPYAAIDRFSDEAGTMSRRSENSDLPGPNEPINFDELFFRNALGPDGTTVGYYDFDVQTIRSAPVYVLVSESDPEERIEGQFAIFDTIPGDDDYNDFWQRVNVLVPDDIEPNSIRSIEDIETAGFEQVRTSMIINCPIVPYGSTANVGANERTGWYEDQYVQYFTFEALNTNVRNPGVLDVPYAIARVVFEDNDPDKGIKLDSSGNNHNVFDTIPGDDLYRALWRIDPVAESAFDQIHDWASSKAAPDAELDMPQMFVNCPVVEYPGSE